MIYVSVAPLLTLHGHYTTLHSVGDWNAAAFKNVRKREKCSVVWCSVKADIARMIIACYTVVYLVYGVV